MERLTLELFTAAAGDAEAARYRIMAAIAEVRRRFRRNRLYPDFSDLAELNAALQIIRNRADELRAAGPQEIVGVDLNRERLIVRPSTDDLFAPVAEIIDWALPELVTLMEEGATVCEFVDEHVDVTLVGILPSFIEEGYLLVPDHSRGQLHVLRYEMSIFTNASNKWRTLKTTALDIIATGGVVLPAIDLKHELLRRFPNMPNPATFSVETDLDLPFRETMLPIEKRKLVATLNMLGTRPGTVH